MSGRPLGFGIETQARDAEIGLKSARGRMRTCVCEAIVSYLRICVWLLHAGFRGRLLSFLACSAEIAVLRRGRFSKSIRLGHGPGHDEPVTFYWLANSFFSRFRFSKR